MIVHDPTNPNCQCIGCAWRRRKEEYAADQAAHNAPYTQADEMRDANELGDGVTYFTHEWNP